MVLVLIRKQDPLKQGLKPGWSCMIQENDTIRKQDPLKQGLKQISPPFTPEKLKIRKQDPLKQGLKPPSLDSLKQNVTIFESKIH